jgi:hypothetical protein
MTIVEPLFVFDFSQVQVRDSFALGQIQQWPSDSAPYDITTELAKVFEGVRWLPNYFAVSTFPSLFGHFLTGEYQKAGFDFIESHINDPLAPALAAAFLHHSWLFCDRLFEGFWQRIVVATDNLTDAIPGLFVQAVSSCVPYLSQWHIKVIRLLREKRGDGAALDVVFGQFLMELVRLWQWSPRFAAVFATEGSIFPVAEALSAYHPDAAKFLGMFSGKILSEYPKGNAMIFYGGIRFLLSRVDTVLLAHFAELLKVLKGGTSNRRVTGDPKTAIVDAFRLRARYIHSFTPVIREPVPTEASVFLTRKKLQERKGYHAFLVGIASGLHTWQLLVESQNRVVSLWHRSASEFYSAAFPALSHPNLFRRVQYRRYGYEAMLQFISEDVVDRVNKAVGGNPTRQLVNEIEQRIVARLTQGFPADVSILESVTEYVDEWKGRLDQSRSSAKVTASASLDYPYCRIFVEAVEKMTFEFTCVHLSDIEITLIDVSSKPSSPRKTLKALIKRNLEPWPEMTGITLSDMGPMTEATCASEEDISFFVVKASAYCRARFDADLLAAKTGVLFGLFIELESTLKPVMRSTAFASPGRYPRWRTELLLALMGGEDPRYLRGGLLKCLLVLKRCRSPEDELGMQYSTVANPFNNEVADIFRNLASWFAMKFDVSI